MGAKTSLAVGILGVAIIAGGAYWLSQKPSMTAAAAQATPPGVVFSTVKMGNAVYVPGASSDQQAELLVFATPARMTLYTFDKDTTPGKSVCNGDCAKAWPALAAPADAKGFGDWSVATRDDGSKQWAFKGKPLYSFAQDAKMGEYKGNGLADGAWHIAFARADDGMALPTGLAAQEVAEAGGQALVDVHGMALYTFDGDVKRDKPVCGTGSCSGNFVPVAAGELSNAVGNFTLVSREDGIQQWAYQGKPLYTYDGDIDLGDANGIGVDKRYQVAMLAKYFMPAGVTIRPDQRRGGLLTTAVDGKTLYARDRVIFNGTGGHNARGGARGIPMIGMAIGTAACDAQCEQTWQPLKAPADAQPSGYWSLANRADGTKQWAYQGYALYTFAGDKKPGDSIGNDTFDFFVNENVQKAAVGPSTGMLDHGIGMYWRVTAP